MAEAGVSCRHTAKPAVAGSLLMAVFSGSEVDHWPAMSGIIGQLPLTDDEIENCTAFPGGAELWSAEAFGGVMTVVIEHGSLAASAGKVISRHKMIRLEQRLAILVAPAFVSHQRLRQAIAMRILRFMGDRGVRRQLDYTARLIPLLLRLAIVSGRRQAARVFAGAAQRFSIKF